MATPSQGATRYFRLSARQDRNTQPVWVASWRLTQARCQPVSRHILEPNRQRDI